jgi:hypothetical protein
MITVGFARCQLLSLEQHQGHLCKWILQSATAEVWEIYDIHSGKCIWKPTSERTRFSWQYPDVLEHRIEEVIDEDIAHSKALFVSRTQQCFAVKSGIDGYLDVAREVFCSTSEGTLPLLDARFVMIVACQWSEEKLVDQKHDWVCPNWRLFVSSNSRACKEI